MKSTNRERLIALLAIGICDAVSNERLSIREAEHTLFSPRTMRELEHCSSLLLPMVHAGTELDDIQSIVPNEYEKALSRIREEAMNALRLLPEYSFQDEPCIDLILAGLREV